MNDASDSDTVDCSVPATRSILGRICALPKVLLLPSAIVITAVALYVAYLGTTSLIYRTLGMNFRLVQVTKLQEAKSEVEEQRTLRETMAFFQRYANSYLRLSLYGEADRYTAIFAEHGEKFIPVEDLRLKKICAPSSDFLDDPRYVQYGARMLVLPDVDGDALPDVVGLSYLGHRPILHRNQFFSALHKSTAMGRLDGTMLRAEKGSGLMRHFLDRRTIWTLIDGSYFRPFGYNALDMDNDGRSDFMVGDELFLSSTLSFERVAIEGGELGGLPVGKDSIFLRRGTETVLVSRIGSELVTRVWSEDAQEIREVARQGVEPGHLDSEGTYQLLPLPDIDGDGAEDFALRGSDTLNIYLNTSDHQVRNSLTLTGLAVGRGHVLTGGFADYDQDGRGDFWIAQSGFQIDDQRVGRAMLVTAETLMAVASPTADVLDVTTVRFLGSSDFSDGDGIGATLSLNAGDIDNDGLPDFSITGHHHLNESGALYILLGQDIEEGAAFTITDPRVLKVRGTELSQLAPPPTHQDSADYNGDGFDDILISADNDYCSGFATGAIYLLDGKKLLARHARPDA